MYWQITPSHSEDADYCLLPAETDADNQAALAYANERLAVAFNQLTPGMLASVTIELCKGDWNE